MSDFVLPIMLPLDVVSMTMTLVNIGAPAGGEGPLASEIERVLTPLPHLAVSRHGDTVVARAELGLPERVVLTGRLTTATRADAAPAFVEMGKLVGLGASDTLGGVAVLLKLAALGHYAHDVTFVFHPGATPDPDLLAGDLVVVLGPTDAVVAADDAVLASPLARSLVTATGGDSRPGAGLVYGPGSPASAGQDDEHVPTAQLAQCEHLLSEWLRG